MDATTIGIFAGLIAFGLPWVTWAFVVLVRASTAVFSEEKS